MSESTTDIEQDDEDFICRVTYARSGWNVEAGPELERYTDATKMQAIGKMLNSLAVRLLQVQDEDLDDYEDEDD